jgi:translocator protein
MCQHITNREFLIVTGNTALIKIKDMKLLYSLLLTIGVGAIAGFATASNIDGWYATLSKPGFNPPNWIFGPVWTILYILMGISLYLICKQPASPHRSNALTLFLIQLFLNFCWSFLFFYFHKIGLALTDIVLLWIMITLTIYSFSKLDRRASWLLFPYICWVSFATILNAAFHHLNP